MIDKIIALSLKNKVVVGLFIVALMAVGVYSLTKLPVDAVPDITNNQVQVISISPTLAVQEVERFITTPIEVSVANIPDVIELRSISRLGLSVVTIVFKDNVDIYKARQLVGERLKEAEDQIPEGLGKPELAPVSSGLGEIYQYTLHKAPGFEKKYTAMDLRTIQDWIVRREMLGTEGVADVNSYGGFLKQYEVAINPEKIRSLNISITEIIEALQKNNENTGGAYIDKKPNAYFIRGIGLAASIDDINKIVVKNTREGLPLLIRDVATVRNGNAPRYGAFVADTTGEAVGGVVMMLKGANASQVIKNVKNRIEVIQKGLPEGITIKPYLDRTDLVGRAIHTVSENLIVGGLIVIFVLVLLLGNLRAGLIVASVIPLSMLFALSLMNLFGVSGNLMSLGAIDFGLIVDGAVIIVESVVHRITMSKTHHAGVKRLTAQQMDGEVFSSARRMMGSATFGQIIILIVYLPILSLVGIEGKMFRPMAEVVSFAILGAIILSLTWVPVASSLFLSKSTAHKVTFSDRIMTRIQRGFHPILDFSLRRKGLIVGLSILLLISSVLVFMRLGGEFIPDLEEGDLAAGIITLQGSSLSNTIETVEKANKILVDNFPEVKQVICKIGAGEIPTDPTPMETGDYIITMKPKSEWTSAKTREEMMVKMEEKLSVLAGVKFEFQQPIQMRFNELMTGSKQDVAVKIFGDNLELLASNADKVEKVIKQIKGIEDINVEKVTGLPQIQITYNRDRIAQYGLNISEINRVLRTAFAGTTAGVIFEEEKRFDLVVRLEDEFRKNLDNVKNIFIPLPSGGQISLDQLASIEIKEGPAQISREDTKRRITIGFNVRGRDVQSVVDEVQKKIEKSLKLPAGYYITYGGQFENLVAAKERLAVAVPVALLLIFVLLFFTFHSVRQSLLIYSAVPLAAVGGVFALWIRGMHFSISAGVGFIALFGVAVLNGIVLIAEFNRLEKEEKIKDPEERVRKGLHTRLRPVIITAAVASLGFLPMALSSSAGAEVQKPLATVVIGGLLTSTLLTLVVLPVLYILFSRRRDEEESDDNSVLPSESQSEQRKGGLVPPILSIVLLVGLIGGLFSEDALAQQRFNGSSDHPRILTLQQAIQQVNDSSNLIKSAAYQVEIQRVLKHAAWNIEKTAVDFEFGQLNSSQKDNNISISQSFSFPTVYANQSKLAQAAIKTSELGLAVTKNEVINAVKMTYNQLVYLHSRHRLLCYQDSILTAFTSAATKREAAGETNLLEKITAESQRDEIRNAVRQNLADIETTTIVLQHILNSTQPIVIADTVLIRIRFSQLDIDYRLKNAAFYGVNNDKAWFEATRKNTVNHTISIQTALLNNPSLALEQQKVEVAAIETKLEKSKLMPDIKIGYFNQSIKGEQNENGIARTYTASDRFTGIQAGIAIPVWFGPQAARIKAAGLNKLKTQTDAAATRQELINQLERAKGEYLKDESSLNYYEQSANPQALLIINQATASYKSGALDYSDYIQSLNRAIQIKANYLEVLHHYNQSIIAIETILGKNN
ncbi:MAG: CusA/CzcA family heavy metal efflux RND transporter [Bacteroidetes bacterium]|nr:CusA/CzcA family heavy metal efflux RND transporter [Bacteroidota bacterium]